MASHAVAIPLTLLLAVSAVSAQAQCADASEAFQELPGAIPLPAVPSGGAALTGGGLVVLYRESDQSRVALVGDRGQGWQLPRLQGVSLARASGDLLLLGGSDSVQVFGPRNPNPVVSWRADRAGSIVDASLSRMRVWVLQSLVGLGDARVALREWIIGDLSSDLQTPLLLDRPFRVAALTDSSAMLVSVSTPFEVAVVRRHEFGFAVVRRDQLGLPAFDADTATVVTSGVFAVGSRTVLVNLADLRSFRRWVALVSMPNVTVGCFGQIPGLLGWLGFDHDRQVAWGIVVRRGIAAVPFRVRLHER